MQTDRAGTSKGYFIDLWMFNQRLPNLFPLPRQHIDDTGRNTRFKAFFSDGQRRVGCQFSRFDNEGTACGKAGAQLPSHQFGR